MSEDRVLDLDELFGSARAVKVKFGGREFELLRIEGIGPRDAAKFQQMQAKAAALKSAKSLTNDNAAMLENAVDEMLCILCSDLPISEMSFQAKIAVIEFYFDETQKKKAAKPNLKQIGAKSSRR